MSTLLTLITIFTLWPHTIEARPEDWTIGQYRVENSYDPSGGRRYTIIRDDQELHSERAGQYWFVNVARGKQTGTSPEPKPTDITADGIPDLIVEQFPLGLECCWSYNIFSLGKNFKHVARLDGFKSPMTFEDVNADGIYEVVGEDPTFYSWYASPRVVLQFKSGRQQLARHLMRRPAPTLEEMTAKTREFRKATVYAGFPVAPEVYRYMLDLIYSGNAESAWKFLDLSWPSGQTGKEEFIQRINDKLKESPYWPELRPAS